MRLNAAIGFVPSWRADQAMAALQPLVATHATVLLEAGNQIPATLTSVMHALGDRLNMGFKGTTATHGRGRGPVVATGMATELGKVAGLLARGGDRSTPLPLRLAVRPYPRPCQPWSRCCWRWARTTWWRLTR